MGDRAYAQVLCRARDVAAFEELGFGEQEYWKGLADGVSFLVDEEAKYGNSSSLRELAVRGYVFIAQHDAGGDDYDAGRLVSDGKHRSQARCWPLRVFQESQMRRLQTKQCEAWRCRREQYLRESGRHVDLIREGYASADDTTNWTVVVGGRARGPLKRDLGTRLFLLKPRLDLHGQYKEINAPAECGQCAAGPQ